jgi:hypothetical protein
VCYRPGDTDKHIDTWVLYDAYSVTTDDLSKHGESIYGDDATPCHRTFFLVALKEAGLVDRIRRDGRHFTVTIPPIQGASSTNR